MQRCSDSLDRENPKRPRYHDNPQQLDLQKQSDPEERVRGLRDLCLNSPSPDIYVEPRGYEKELRDGKLPEDTSLDAPDHPSRPLMNIAEEFLDG
ncbi:hypothetical protein BGZ95_006960, partial [Linnemannia exigua]